MSAATCPAGRNASAAPSASGTLLAEVWRPPVHQGHALPPHPRVAVMPTSASSPIHGERFAERMDGTGGLKVDLSRTCECGGRHACELY